MNLSKQKTFEEMGFDDENSKASDHENLISEIQEDFQTEINENDENSAILSENFDEKSLEKLEKMEKIGLNCTKRKFANVKNKILLNKTKNRLETKVNLEIYKEMSSSESESVTKSPRSLEKKKNNEKSIKELWLIFRKKFFYSEKIEKFKKKVGIFLEIL